MRRSSTDCALSGAIRPAVVDNSSLVHTAWDLGAPLNTVDLVFSARRRRDSSDRLRSVTST